MTLQATKTVGEIAAEMPTTTRAFEKLGIDYCCGGNRTLTQACTDANVPVDEVLTRLQESLVTTPDQAGQDWQKQWRPVTAAKNQAFPCY